MRFLLGSMVMGALAIAACGPGEVSPEDCTALQVTSDFSFGGGGFWGLAIGAAIEPQIDEGYQGLSIKLRDESGPLAPGSFDLSLEAIDTCDHCVYVLYAGSGDHVQLAFAESGTMTLEEVNGESGEAVGTLRDVLLRHRVETSLHTWEGIADDNRCFFLQEAAFDTRAVEGRPCTRQGECPNASLQACDPRTLSCAAIQCSSSAPACPGADVCVVQDPLFDAGACYQACAPFTSGACPDGQTCVVVDYMGQQGVCKWAGPEDPSTFQDCSPQHASTGCGPGEVCATDAIYWHAGLCYPQCDFFADDPGCASGRCWLKGHDQDEIDTNWLCGVGDCHFGGLCTDEVDDPAFYGEDCDPEHEGWPCAGEETRMGVCKDGVCTEQCLLEGGDCPPDQACEPWLIAEGTDAERAIPGVGLCR
jgi:hypothetical protein